MPNPNVNRKVTLYKPYVSLLLASWYNSLTVKPSVNLLLALNILVDTLDRDGIWSELDLFHTVGGMETDEQILRPLKSTAGVDFTAVNSPTLDSTGVTGSAGTGAYVMLNWDPFNNGVKWTQNSASFGTYCRTNTAETVSNMGSSASFDSTRRVGDNFIWRINDVGSSSAANTSSLGFSHVRRTASGATEVYMNAVSKGTGTVASAGLDGTDFTLCRHSGSTISSRNLSALFAGSSSVDPTTFYARIQTFMTTRGINV